MNKKICDDCPYAFDSLTGLIRREVFSKKLRDDHQCDLLIVCDVDFFKTFNDSYGHLAGDKVLKDFSDTLKKCCFDDEIIARFGGEEFVIALRGGQFRAEEFFRNVKKNMGEIEFEGQILPKITFSAGTANLYDDLWSSFSKADKAVYFSKENGRDQINHYEKMFRYIENNHSKSKKKPKKGKKSTGYAIFSVWEKEKIIYEKGNISVNKMLNEFEDVLREEFDIVEIFRTKENDISMVFRGKRDPDTRLKIKRLTRENPMITGVLNFYPGITAFAYLERDTYNAFKSLFLFRENQGIILYSVKTIRSIGNYYFNRGQFRQAYEYYRRAHKLQKDDVGMINLSTSMIKIGKTLSSCVLLRTFEDKLSKYEEFYVNLSLCYYKLGRLKDSYNVMHTAEKVFPDSRLISRNKKELECLERD